MINSNLAPILLFAYNRTDHLKETVNALRENTLAGNSILYIISDGPRINDIESFNEIEKVRAYISTITGFGEIRVIQNQINLGLAKSIIDTVTSLIEKYKKVIVLEDDIITSKYFLEFMNEGLDLYKNSTEVWHLSGWNYPLLRHKRDTGSFLWRGMNCWGWATWEDRWKHFNKQPERLVDSWSKSQIADFNIDNRKNFFSQVKLNHDGKLNTWAIFWYATIFENNGLCLNPVVSMTKNIGLDGSGSNCKKQTNNDYFAIDNKVTQFPSVFHEDKYFLKEIKKYLRMTEPSVVQRIKDKLYRMFSS